MSKCLWLSVVVALFLGAAAFGQTATTQATSRASRPSKVRIPVAQIGDKTYALEDLFGVTLEEFDEQFEKQISSWTDDKLRGAIPPSKPTKGLSRKELIRTYRDCYLSGSLTPAMARLAYGYLARRVADELGINLEEYYDLDALRKRLDAEVRFHEWLTVNARTTDVATVQRVGRELLDESVSEASAKWLIDGNSDQTRVRILRMSEFYRRFRDMPEFSAACMVAHDTLAEACTSGVYYSMAKSKCDAMLAALYEVTIQGYSGDEESLRSAIRALLTEDGSIAQLGFKKMATILAKIDPAVVCHIRQVTLMGDDLPGVGFLARENRENYRLYTWAQPLRKDQAQAVSSLAKARAWELAYNRFKPTVTSLGGQWEYMDALALAVLRGGRDVMYEDTHNYVRKPFPTALLTELEQSRGVVHTYAARVADAQARGDKERLRSLVAEMKKRAAETKLPNLKRNFGTLINFAEQAK